MTAISRNRPPAHPMPKRHYLLAIACYLAIPVVFIAGGAMHQLIDPEWALRSADYVPNYRLLELLAQGVLMAAGMLALVLWLATCFFLLKARERSVAWLLLAAAGPLGFTFIATLRDLAPAPDDLYQQIVPRLKLYLRIPFEIAAFVGVWACRCCPCSHRKGPRTPTDRLERSETSNPSRFECGGAVTRQSLVSWGWCSESSAVVN